MTPLEKKLFFLRKWDLRDYCILLINININNIESKYFLASYNDILKEIPYPKQVSYGYNHFERQFCLSAFTFISLAVFLGAQLQLVVI